jgi:SAM-dependent methyltransferase
LRALSEIARVLRTGGRALIYAWALEQVSAGTGHCTALARCGVAQHDVLQHSAPRCNTLVGSIFEKL